MTVSESLRVKVRALLLHPTTDGLDRALHQILLIRDGLKGEVCSPAEARTIRQELMGIGLLARQVRRLYGAMLAASSKRDDAAANYTPTGRFVTATCESHPGISQVIHG